ncbi:DUF305 domain-containing protein [Actinomadura sp. HBU206391]|uniref:DUF305 domain-containing protein n=1 Tax=Actinomadura sp. HBU206391 TaxID=2731692 RepID=UPI00164FD6D0|nr:DUF305 domain-containing protein [Actinomadura sp. HBU206391]MBC6462483.1 DUF305 domain-containing protein [Actinomadura sp. HBU206391]
MGVKLAGIGLVIAAFAVAGCSGGDEKTPRSSPGVVGSGAPVIVPGRPGEPNRTAKPGETVDSGVRAANDADVRFMQRMIPHHEQALEMTALVKDRAQNTKLRALADRIGAAQGPEISAMQSWLRSQGKSTAGGGHGHGAHGAGAMPGMATPEQMNKLKAVSGKEFDKLFLELMIAHHKGAITMANEVLGAGADVTVNRMAIDVNTGQASEIRRMQDLLQPM